MKNYFSQKCPHCGNTMYISSITDKVTCLNCNQEFEVDKEKLEKFNEENEAKVSKAIKRKKENRRIDFIALCIIAILLVICSIGLELRNRIISNSNIIKTSYSSHYFRNENLSLENTIKKLKRNGFSNIEYEAIYDIHFGIFTKAMEVEKVTINGQDIYIKGDEFPKDSKVVIYYHDLSENETKGGEDELKDKTRSYYGTFIGDSKSVLIIGKDKSVYYYKDSIYDDNVICSEEKDRVILDVKSLGYKIYFDKRMRYDFDFEIKSTNENWITEKFLKVSNEVDYNKNEMNRIISSSTSLSRMTAGLVKKMLESDGYTNVMLVPQYDVIFGILVSAGEVDRVSINGETQFDTYLDYPKDSIIKIYYHEDSSMEPT